MMSSSESTRQNYWQEHVRQWQNSSLSQADYCKKNQLLPHRLGYWKRKLLQPEKSTSNSSGFTQIKIPNEPAHISGLTLVLPNGCRIEGLTQNNWVVVSQLIELLQ